MAIGEHQKLPTAFLASIKHVAKVRRRPPSVCHLHTGAAATHLGRSKAENMAATLEPASPAVPTAAADKQHYDYDDQKSCGVHTVLLIADERDRGPCNPKNQKGPSLVPEAAN